MAEETAEEETYSLIFSSLRHPIRRKILRMLTHSPMAFSEMLNALSMDSGHLSYHLDQLDELISHTADSKICAFEYWPRGGEADAWRRRLSTATRPAVINGRL